MFQELTSEVFIRRLCNQVHKGYGITPFAGAGISSRSGIIMGVEFAEYLTYTVFRSVVHEEEQSRMLGQTQQRLWNVRHDGWPDNPKPYEADAVRVWVSEQYERLCKLCGVMVHFDRHKGNRTVTVLSPAVSTPDGPSMLDAQIRRPLLPAILKGESTMVNDQAVKDFLRAVGNEDAARGHIYRVGISADSQEGLIERAIRSLHDWRAVLHFLAELDMIPDGQRRRAFLSHHDPGVIDSFNTHITWGRKPNLAHSMLAHLADPMRTRSVLTTNFDTLLEDAFAQLGEPLTVIPVGLHSQLPSPNTVHAQNTLVKLHGALTDTRADYSLDELPTPVDKARFFHYVTGGPPPRSTASPLMRILQPQPPPFLSTHLLVIGFGGGDNRILQLMKFVLDHSPETRIFWVCFSNSDLLAMPRLFSEPDYEGRIEVTVTDRSDLLLLELHQKLTCGLPRGGFSYQFSHDVPPKLWKKEHDEDKRGPGEGGTGGEAIAKRIRELSEAVSKEADRHRKKERQMTGEAAKGMPEKLLRRPWLEQNKVLVVDTESGLMAVLKEAFETLKRERFSCVWMEMEDYSNAQELAHALLQIIALRRGLFQLEHAVLMPALFHKLLEQDSREPAESSHNRQANIGDGSHAWRERFFRTSRYFGIQKEKWVIFFYGRNVPGICAGWHQAPWEKEQYQEFHQMLDGLAANGFLVVYAPYSRRRWSEDKKKADATRLLERKMSEEVVFRDQQLLDCVEPKNFPRDLWNADAVHEGWIDGEVVVRAAAKHLDGESRYQVIKVHPNPSTTHYIGTLLPYFHNDIVQPIYRKQSSDDDILRAQFLYSCSLFRRSRPTSAFLSEGVLPPFSSSNAEGLDNDWARQDQAQSWVVAFREKGFVWRKPGGNVWLYRDARLGMQSILQKCVNVPVWSDEGRTNLKNAYQLRARTHFWIAAWYTRAFFTTSHSVPLIEALHHLYRSLQFAPLATPPKQHDAEEIVTYRRQIWIRSLTSMTKLLRVGRSALLFWMDRPAAEAMFGPITAKRIRLDIITTQKTAFGRPAPVKSPIARVEKYAAELTEIFFAEWETLWSEFERLPFQSRFGNHTSSETPPEASYSMVSLFCSARDWRQRISPGQKPAHLTNEWTTILEKHEFDPGSHEADAALYRRLRRLGDKAGRQHLGNESLPQLIEALHRLAYDHLRRAKFYELIESEGPIEADCLPAYPSGPRIWVQVMSLCRSVFNLCRSVPPHLVDFEYSMRVSSGTLYGLALGRLARFTEAHRRLNESNARLSKLPRRVDQVEMAIIELRRAEVYLLEARFLGHLIDLLIGEIVSGYDSRKKKFKRIDSRETAQTSNTRLLLRRLLGEVAMTKTPASRREMRIVQQWWETYELGEICLAHRITQPKDELTEKDAGEFVERMVKHLSRIHFARLDDAWVALEQAERLLAGRTRSSQWWGRLCTLRLKVFAEHWNEETIKDRLKKRGLAVFPDFVSRLQPVICSTMAFRRKIDYKEYLISLFRIGLVVWPDDPFRRLRLAHYFMRAWERRYKKGFDSHDIKTLLCEAMEQGVYDDMEKNPKYGLLAKYRRIVADKAAELIRHSK